MCSTSLHFKTRAWNTFKIIFEAAVSWKRTTKNITHTHFSTDQLANHERGVFQSVVVIVVVTRRRDSLRTERALAASVRACAIGVLGVEGINDDGLRTLDFTATEGAALAFRLLKRNEQSFASASLASVQLLSEGSSRLPARPWDRKCTWDVRTARSSRPCRSQRRSCTAGRWSPSRSTAHIAPVGLRKRRVTESKDYDTYLHKMACSELKKVPVWLWYGLEGKAHIALWGLGSVCGRLEKDNWTRTKRSKTSSVMFDWCFLVGWVTVWLTILPESHRWGPERVVCCEE